MAEGRRTKGATFLAKSFYKGTKSFSGKRGLMT
jgi:hypothetical protein